MAEEALLGKFIRTYNKGDIVFEEGSQGQEMYIIASGAVKVTTNKQGRETLLSRLSAGEFFAEMSLVDAAPRSGRVTVEEEGTRLIELDLSRFLYLIQQQPVFALTILHTLCQRIRRLNTLYSQLMEKAGNEMPEHVSFNGIEGGAR